MSLETFLVWILIGAVAGWLAGVIVDGYGFGLAGNIVLGIVGAFVGERMFAYFGISTMPGIPGTVVAATAGAVVILVVVGLLRRVA